ncbi:hypothetical protein HD553DRAFT_341585 [Filobasidium floriforme]|uniref:uncharacterized protein n=1 Tax=Filobasidium floriforme TaxID=5210 RepID=UPI001E8D174C|nr:uncharacterized protein HD553DRAFT_341585 [Filobasidium floriforme]KAH8085791.1 hypothetical protein HD553DRAFT_341585 [Filobasidium floriforme]
MSNAQGSQNATASSSSRPKPKQWGGAEAAAARHSKRLAAQEEAREAREKADREKAENAEAEADRWEEQQKKKRAREDTDSGSGDSEDEYVEEGAKKKRSKRGKKAPTPLQTVDDETDGDELDDEQETEAAASDPNFAGDKQRAVLGEYLPQFWKYQAARKYWTPQRVYEYWMEAREIVREKKKVPEGEEVKASAHIESAMHIYFAPKGKVWTGRKRCTCCQNLPLKAKRRISKDVPGIILKCKQISPTGRCAQCAIGGNKCSLQSDGDELVRVKKGLDEELPYEETEALAVALETYSKKKASPKGNVFVDKNRMKDFAELARFLADHVAELKDDLQGLPVRYDEVDEIEVLDVDGDIVDFS